MWITVIALAAVGLTTSADVAQAGTAITGNAVNGPAVHPASYASDRIPNTIADPGPTDRPAMIAAVPATPAACLDPETIRLSDQLTGGAFLTVAATPALADAIAPELAELIGPALCAELRNDPPEHDRKIIER